MAGKKEPVRFAPEAFHIPAWDHNHPLFKQFGSATWEVQTAHGVAPVEIPAVKDAKLADIIAALAVYFTGTFIKSHRDMGYVIAESVAQAYEELGGSREAWRAYVTDDLGIAITAQADNDFVTFLRVLSGTANDPSRHLGKLAQYLDRWVTIRSEGWENWPSPHIGDGLPAKSDMTCWAKHMRGWSDIAERHATWLRERDCLRCGTHFNAKGHETCPRCDRPIHDLSPRDGDIRVVGVRVVTIPEAELGSVDDAEFPECHAEHPEAVSWRIQRFEPVTRADGTEDFDWMEIADGYDDLASVEEGAQRHRREQYYSESISEIPETGNRPQDGSAAATANSESIKKNSAAKPTKKPTTSPNSPRPADWTGGLKNKKKETVVNIEAAKARHEAEEAAQKVADLEQKLTEAERRAAAAGPQQWRETPDDFAKAAVATDANKAIDAMEALQDALRGTPEWRAYQEELFQEFARTTNKIKEERDAEKRAELAVDPKEQRIARIKNALVMALRSDTDEHQRNAAFAGALRMCEDGDLAFLDRLSTAPPDPLPPTTQIVEGSPLDWFLRQTPEQFRKHAEEYADRLGELRPQISAFLKALNAFDPRRKEAAEDG